MRIVSSNRPHAGRQFQFVVSGATGRTRIEAYVDTKRVLKTECPDPPCHEMIKIPALARGSVLRLIAIDSIGNSKEREFMIADSEGRGGGGMMAGAGG